MLVNKRVLEPFYLVFGMGMFTLAMYFRDWQAATIMGLGLLITGLLEQRQRQRAHISTSPETPPEAPPKLSRRAQLKANGGSHTVNEWRLLCALYNWRCASCEKKRPLTKDHIIPVIQGGSDDISNIQPLCRACNSSKHGRAMRYEWQ